jgi:putative thioredoxin
MGHDRAELLPPRGDRPVRPATAGCGPRPSPDVPDRGRRGGYSFDVTEEGFQPLVLEASTQHPVVLALWSSRAPQSREAVDALARIADTYQGKLSLARLDVDSQPPAGAGAAGASCSVRSGCASRPARCRCSRAASTTRRRARRWIRWCRRLWPTASPVAPNRSALPPPRRPTPPGGEAADPRFAEADAALERGDTEQAVSALRRLLQANPADSAATTRLAQAELVLRTTGVDLQTARAAAAADPDDAEAQLLAADVDLLGGHVDDAFDRVIEVIRRSAGDDRDSARRHLLSLFDVVGVDDPRVLAARRRLANALF